MKKILLIFLSAALIMLIASCEATPQEESAATTTTEMQHEVETDIEEEAEIQEENGTEEITAEENEDIKWQNSLENFLTQFPTLLDETARWEAGNGMVVPVDAETVDWLNGAITVPGRIIFLDLDGDNIPEAIIRFGIPESEYVYDRIYKLFDDSDSYEEIEQLTLTTFYANPQGKLVVSERSNYMTTAIYFAEVQDKKLTLSDYIDANGNDNYNGVKYNNLPELYQGMHIEAATDLDDTLQELSEIDCSDIMNTAKNRVYDEVKKGK